MSVLGTSSAEPELIIEPIIGWRSWRTVRTEDGPRLQSPQQGTLWPTSGRLIGQCEHEHVPLPARACLCGVNAFADAHELIASHPCYSSQPIIGQVALTGEVRCFERGWRGQHAQPVKIWARTHRHRRAAREVAAQYGIEYAGVVGAKDSPWAERSRPIYWAAAAWTALAAMSAIGLMIWPLPEAYEGANQAHEAAFWSLTAACALLSLFISYHQATLPLTRIVRFVCGRLGLMAAAALALVLMNSYSLASVPRPMKAGDMIKRMEAQVGAPLLYTTDDEDLPSPVRNYVKTHNLQAPEPSDLAAQLGISDMLIPDQTVCTQPRRITWCYDGDQLIASRDAQPRHATTEPWSVATVSTSAIS